MADEILTTLRVCSKCGVEKARDNFRKHRRQCRDCERSFALEYNKTRDPEKTAAWLREARRKDPERYREYDRLNQMRNRGAGSEYEKRRYAQRDKVKAREDLKRWKEANPALVKAAEKRNAIKNRHVHTVRMLRWIKNNPQKAAIIRNRRRARELEAPGEYTINDVRDLMKRFGRICFYCGAELTKFHVDHFIPLVRKGSNGPKNLRLSCPPCNWSKGGKMPWEWMPDKFRCDETA